MAEAPREVAWVLVPRHCEILRGVYLLVLRQGLVLLSHADLELTMLARLALNSGQSSCLRLPRAGVLV